MPRQTRRQTTIRAGAPEELRKPAAPAPSHVPPVRYSRIHADRSAGQAEMRMSRALAGAADVLGDIGRRQVIRQEEEAYKQGQTQAMQDNLTGLENFQQKRAEYAAGQSDAWMKGYDRQAGRAAGYKVLEDVRQSITDQRDSLDDQGFDDIWRNAVQSATKGMEENSEYTRHLVSVLSEGERQIRDGWSKHKLKQAHENVTNDYDSAFRNDLHSLVESGGSEQDIHSLISAYRDQGNVMGLSKQEAAQYVVDNVIEIAKRTKNPALLGVLDMQYVDVDNPDTLAPKYTEQAQYGRRIDNAIEDIENDILRTGSKEKQQRIYELDRSITEFVERGEYGQAYELLEPAIEQGLVTGRQAATYANMIDSVKAIQREKADAAADVYAGEAWDRPEEVRREVVEEAASELYFDAGDVPAQVMKADQSVALLAIGNGVMPKVHIQTIKNAPLSSEEGFARGYELYQTYREIDPAFVTHKLGEKTDARYTHYETLRRQGYDHAGALELMRETYTYDKFKTARDALEKDEYLNRDIEDELVKDFDRSGDSWGGADAANGGYVTDMVRKHMRAYMVYTPGADPEVAKEWALKQFEGNHTRVYTEDGESFRWVWRGGMNTSPDFEAAQQDLSNEVGAALKDTPQAAPFYYLMPSPTNPEEEVIVMRGDRDLPVLTQREDGSYGPLVRNRGELVQGFRAKEDARIAEENQKLRERKEKERKQQEKFKGRVWGAAHEEGGLDLENMLEDAQSINLKGKRSKPKSFKTPVEEGKAKPFATFSRDNEG